MSTYIDTSCSYHAGQIRIKFSTIDNAIVGASDRSDLLPRHEQVHLNVLIGMVNLALSHHIAPSEIYDQLSEIKSDNPQWIEGELIWSLQDAVARCLKQAIEIISIHQPKSA